MQLDIASVAKRMYATTQSHRAVAAELKSRFKVDLGIMGVLEVLGLTGNSQYATYQGGDSTRKRIYLPRI